MYAQQTPQFNLLLIYRPQEDELDCRMFAQIRLWLTIVRVYKLYLLTYLYKFLLTYLRGSIITIIVGMKTPLHCTLCMCGPNSKHSH